MVGALKRGFLRTPRAWKEGWVGAEMRGWPATLDRGQLLRLVCLSDVGVCPHPGPALCGHWSPGRLRPCLPPGEEAVTLRPQRGSLLPLQGFSSLRLRPIRTLSSALEQLRGCKVVGVIEKVSERCPRCGRT